MTTQQFEVVVTATAEVRDADGNLVSAPAWPAHPDWIAQFLAVLGTRITH